MGNPTWARGTVSSLRLVEEAFARGPRGAVAKERERCSAPRRRGQPAGAARRVPAPRKPAGGHFGAAEKENVHAEALRAFCGLSDPAPSAFAGCLGHVLLQLGGIVRKTCC